MSKIKWNKNYSDSTRTACDKNYKYMFRLARRRDHLRPFLAHGNWVVECQMGFKTLAEAEAWCERQTGNNG